MGRKADKRVDLKMPPGALQTYRRLLRYLKPHKGTFAIGVNGLAGNLGIAIGLLFGWAMQQALADLGVSRLAVPWGLLVVFAVIAGLLGLFASIAPAIRASRIKVLEAISYE